MQPVLVRSRIVLLLQVFEKWDRLLKLWINERVVFVCVRIFFVCETMADFGNRVNGRVGGKLMGLVCCESV